MGRNVRICPVFCLCGLSAPDALLLCAEVAKQLYGRFGGFSTMQLFYEPLGCPPARGPR